MNHTPTPWRLDDGGNFVRGRDGDDIAAPHGLNSDQIKANAAFIVRAVNAHEHLLTALKNCFVRLRDIEEDSGIKSKATVDLAQRAIAKAEGR